ncbi:hypothetical protein ACWD7C_39725 [Streptomyces sp. NPDC005134]
MPRRRPAETAVLRLPGAHAVEDAAAPAGEVTLVAGAELDVDDLR